MMNFLRRARRKDDVPTEAVGKPKKRRRPLGIMPLEPRVMYDAAAAATAASATDNHHPAPNDGAVSNTGVPADTTHPNDTQTTPPPAANSNDAGNTNTTNTSSTTPASDASPTQSSTGTTHEIVIIDGDVPNLQTLIDGAKPGDQVFVLDPTKDGVQQIADIIAANNLHDLSAIQIISHGSDGQVVLGSTVLTDANISGFADKLGQIGASLAPGGDILLYGCDVGAGTAGQQFLGDLSRYTGGANVAAATHDVGSTGAVTDWTLDATTGPIEATLPFTAEALASYQAWLGSADGQLFLIKWGEQIPGVNDQSLSYVNSDGTTVTDFFHNTGQNVPLDFASQIAVDTTAGLYFVVTQSHDLSHSTADEAYEIYEGRLGSSTAPTLIYTAPSPNGNVAGVINGITIDTANYVVYFTQETWTANYGALGPDTGIVSFSYNPTATTFSTVAATDIITKNGSTGAHFSGFNDPGGIAFDAVHNKLYFTDTGSAISGYNFPTVNAVEVYDLTTHSLTTLATLASGPNDPDYRPVTGPDSYTQGLIRSVAVDPIHNLVFFSTADGNTSQGFSQNGIWVVNMDGTGKTQLTLPAGSPSTATHPLMASNISYDAGHQELYVSFQMGVNNASGTDANGHFQGDVVKFSVTGTTAQTTALTSAVTYDLSVDGTYSKAGAFQPHGIAVDSLPVLTLNNAGMPTFTEPATGLATAVSLLPGPTHITIADSDNSQVTRGTITLTNSVAGDKLQINISSLPAGITIDNVNSTDTKLVLIGAANLASYEIAFEQVTFVNNSTNPTNNGSNTSRTINWQVDDGAINAPQGTNVATTTLTVVATNRAPSVMAPSAQTAIEDASKVISDAVSHISVSDVDSNPTSDNVLVVLSVTNGKLTLPTNITNGLTAADIVGNGTGTVTLTAPQSKINATLADANGLTYLGNLNFNGTDTLTITINDQGHTGQGGALTDTKTVSIAVGAVNDGPVQTNVGPTVSVNEQTPALLDSDVTVSDAELDALNNYAGASLAVTRNGGANAQDSFSFDTTGASFTVSGGNLQSGGQTFATFTNAGGTLTINFTSGQTAATTALVNDALRHISYTNTSDAPPASATLAYTFNDGNSAGAQGTGGAKTDSHTTTVNIAPVNDAPTLSATGNSPSFTEGGPAVDLFSNVTINTIENSQNIAQLTFTVSNVADGAGLAEILGINGHDVTLNNANSVNIGNGVTASVSLSGGTATVTLSNATGVDGTTLAGMIDGMTYRNTSETPSAANRVVTLTSIKDSGGTANGGVDTKVLSIGSIVTVVPVNSAPTLTATGTNPTFTEDGAATGLFNNAAVSTIELGQSITQLQLTVSNVSDGALEILNIDGSDVALINGTSTTATNGMTATVMVSGSTATVTISKTDGITSDLAQTLVNNLSYHDNSQNPTGGTRAVTLTSIQDSGGTADLGHDTATLTVASIVTVTPVNDAPVLDPSKTPVLDNETEDAGAPVNGIAAGTLVSSLIGIGGVANVTDVDNTSTGIALTGVDSTHGIWSYSTDGGAHWSAVGVVSDTAALLLKADANTLLYFQPDANFNGTVNNAITFHAWDQSTGPVGTKVDTSANGGTTAFSTATDTADISITADNDAPVVSLNGAAGGNDATASFTEQTGIAIAPSATIGDVDSANLNSLTVTLTSPPDGAAETLSLDLAADTARTNAGLNVSYSNGVLTITGPASVATYQTILQGVVYNNSSDDPHTADRTINVVASDDASASSTQQRVTVSLTPVNDAPTLSATGKTVTFTEGGSAVDLFSNATLDTIESGQKVAQLTFAVSNVTNGAAEILNIDGADLSLTGQTDVGVGSHGLTATVTLAGGTATVTLSNAGGVDGSTLAGIINGMTYRNTSEDPSGASRVVTLTSIKDDGGTANGGVDTTTLSIASTVTVTGVNDAPTLTATSTNPGFTEDGAAAALFNNVAISTIEAGQTITQLQLTVDHVADGASEILNIDGSDVALTNSNSVTTATGTATVSVSSGGTATVTWSSAGVAATTAQSIVDNITYRDSSQNPPQGARTVTLTSIQDSGGTANSGHDTTTLTVASTVTVTPVNDAPVLDASKTPVLDQAHQADVAPSGTVGTLVSSLVDIGGPLSNVTDPDGNGTGIALTHVDNTNGSWFYSIDGGSHWTAVGTVSDSAALLLKADADTRLYFQPNGTFFGTDSLAITFRTWDQSDGNANGATVDMSHNGGTTAFSSATDTAEIFVKPTNVAPVIDLDADNSNAAGSGYSALVTDPSVLTTGVQVTDSDVTITDPDNGNMASATVTLTTRPDGDSHESLSLNSAATNAANAASVSFNYDSATGTLTITGNASKATYETILEGVVYKNNVTPASTANRTINFVVDDGGGSGSGVSATATSTIYFHTLDLNGPSGGTSFATTYTETSTAAPTDSAPIVGANVTVTDSGSDFTKATITIKNYQSGEDVLAFTANANTGDIQQTSYAGGVLTLTSASGATTAQWQAALQATTYSDSSHAPITTARDIAIVLKNATYSTNEAHTTVSIVAVNDAPMNTVPGAQTTNEDVGKAINGISISDIDSNPATDIVTVTLSVGHGTLALQSNVTNGLTAADIAGNGTATVILTGTQNEINLTLAAANGLTYLGNADFNGNDTLTITTNDLGHTGTPGALSDVDTVSITVTPVNDAPTAVASTVTTNEDAPKTFSASDFQFTDAHDTPSDALGAVIITGLPTQGTLMLHGVAVSANQPILATDIGSLVYTPNADYNGSDSFTYKVKDNGGNSDTSASSATMTINVTPVNDAPVASGTATFAAVNEDATSPAGATVGSLFGGNFSDATDNHQPGGSSPDDFAGIAISSYTADAAKGTWQYSTNGTTWTILGNATASSAITLSANDLLRFVPAANYNGSATALNANLIENGASITDGGTVDLTGAATGGTTHYSATTVALSETITSVNDAPTALASTVTTNEDAPKTFSASDFQFTDAQDTPSDALAAVIITGLPTQGTLMLHGVAVSANQPILATDIGSLVYTPNADYNGSDSFTYKVKDNGGGTTDTSANSATMTINVTSVNDAPTAVASTVTTNEDTAKIFTVADFQFTDSHDSPANGLSNVIITGLPTQGALTLDGTAVTLNEVVSQAAIAAGKLVFTPALDANGSSYASFSFQVVDNGGGSDTSTNSATMTINVTSVNDAPTAVASTVTTNEDTAKVFSVSDFHFTDSQDTPANGLSNVIITSLALPAGSTLMLDGNVVFLNEVISQADIAAGKLVFTPTIDANGNGYASFGFQVVDNGGGGSAHDTSTNSATMTIDVAPVNDAPTAVASTVTTNEDAPKTFAASDFQFTDAHDTPPDALTAVIITGLPTQGTLMLNGNAVSANQTILATEIGGLVYTPNADYNGSDSFTYKVKDTGGGGDTSTNSATMTINVTPANDAPTAVASTVTTNEDTAKVFTVADFQFTDSHDTPANGLSNVIITSLALPAGSTLTLDGTAVTLNEVISQVDIAAGKLKFTPVRDANGNGYASFGFQVVDNGGGGSTHDTSANSATMTVDVTAVNDAPELGGVPATVPYTPGSGPQVIANGITVSDIDSPNLTSATIQITDGILGDTLAANVGSTSISATYNAGTQTLTLTGPGTLADYQQVLRSVTFNTTSGSPTRTIVWQLNDGSGANNLSDPQNTQVQLHTLDLDTGTAGFDFSASYTEHTAGVAVVGTVAINDSDTGTMTQAVITITNAQANDLLSIDGTLPSGITSHYDYAAGKGTLTLSGSDTLANYQAALAQVRFLINGNITNISNRDITVSVTDALAVTTNVAHTAISLIDRNDAPVLDTAGSSLSVFEGDGPKAVDAALTLIDDDSSNMTGATVAITKNFTAGEDFLGFGDGPSVTSGLYQGAIAWNYNAATGVMTLTGNASKVIYQDAFQHINYFNGSGTPSGESRGVSLQVSDDGENGTGANPLTSNAVIVPVAVTPHFDYDANKGGSIVLEPHIGEPDSTVTLTHAEVSISTGFANGDSLNFTNQNGITGSYNKATGVLTLTGSASLADYQAALATITFSSRAQTTSLRTISWSMTDGVHDLTYNAPHTTQVQVQGAIVATIPRNDPPVDLASGASNVSPPEPYYPSIDISVHEVPVGDAPAMSFVQVNLTRPDIASSVGDVPMFAVQVSLLDLLAALPSPAVAVWALQADGEPLPAWLHFDPSTGIFAGEVPPDQSGTLKVEIIARDSQGHEAISTIAIDLVAQKIIGKQGWNMPSHPGPVDGAWPPEKLPRSHASAEPMLDADGQPDRNVWQRHAAHGGAVPGDIEQATPPGRAGLSDQLKKAGWRAMHAQRTALLDNLRLHASGRH